MIRFDPSRRAPWLVGLALLGVYALTLAPGVTFWDAGEFIAAARTLGIPHPPGTPLVVLALNVWARALGFLPFAVATNLASAVVTATAAGLTAALVQRATRDAAMGAAAALCAGSMTSVWLNATETEVYAATLALAVLALWCGERAGRLRSTRWRVLLAYIMVASVPLHMSALVGMPAAVYLATASTDDRIDWESLVALFGVLFGAGALGLMSPTAAVAGLALLLASPVAPRVAEWVRRRGAAELGSDAQGSASTPTPLRPQSVPTPSPVRPQSVPSPSPLRLRLRARLAWLAPADTGAGAASGVARLAAYAAVAAVGATGVLFLLLRARHDPAINQGNPASWNDLAYVVARRQYAVSPMWPRSAPLWLQIGNVFEWADWQVALSFAPTVIPTVWRVLATICFVWLAIEGALAHFARDRRTARALAIWTLCGSLGVVAYLNLRLGPSFGWGVVPDNTVREARERDYFFVLGFWGWGVWAGMGAVSLVRRRGWTPALGVAVAALPIALNWRAIDRRRQPEADLPRVFADALLESAPPDGVLFVAGDNDTYPIWAAQQVRGLRRDVTVVTLPLLPAGWYQREIARRDSLLWSAGLPLDARQASQQIAVEARRRGRPIAVAATVTARERRALGQRWTVRGLVYLPRDGASADGCVPPAAEPTPPAGVTELVCVDTTATRRWSERIAAWRRGRYPSASTDPAASYAIDVLACPAWMLDPKLSEAQRRSLDSTCNLR